MCYNRLMSVYTWQQDNWPNFRYHEEALEDDLYSFAERVGKVSGTWQALPEQAQQEALVQLMSAEAIKSSKIEGINLNRSDVYSSIQKNLGFAVDAAQIGDQRALCAAELAVAVRQHWHEPLSGEVLCDWHRKLLAGSSGLVIGAWRSSTNPMRLISGPLGRETVHFEAPPSDRVAREMQQFLLWFNQTDPGAGMTRLKTPIRSALSHLHFETIHPFEDGNGRIGRAIAEKALSQGIGRPVLVSLSSTIESDRSAYYHSLNRAQRSLEVTDWIRYFLQVMLDAQLQAERIITFTLYKGRFFHTFADQLNDRHQKVLRRMLQEGPDGFTGGINARTYMSITKTSKATATRDLQQLLAFGVITPRGTAAGRSTSYQINPKHFPE